MGCCGSKDAYEDLPRQQGRTVGGGGGGGGYTTAPYQAPPPNRNPGGAKPAKQLSAQEQADLREKALAAAEAREKKNMMKGFQNEAAAKRLKDEQNARPMVTNRDNDNARDWLS